MIVIAVVDDRYGMMFHQRRQSQDRMLRERILSITEGAKLWMSPYSYRQFEVSGENQIENVDNFLDLAGEGEYCFVEDQQVMPYEKKIEKVILFHWNRTYPGDVYWDIDLEQPLWKLVGTEEFEGSSHEKITMEVYEHEA